MRVAAITGFLLNCLLYGCITPYEQSGIDPYQDLLVVDGVITNGTTVITLSKAIGLSAWFSDKVYVENATLYVECEDGERSNVSLYEGEGRYLIETPTLNTELTYRLKIYLDGKEYQSNYLAPLTTPEVTTSWYYDLDEGITVCVSTHDEQEQYRHYLWSYREYWEITSEFNMDTFYFEGKTMINDISSSNNYYRCWKQNSPDQFYIASTEQLSSNTIYDHALNNFSWSDERVSTLYCMEVKQNLIRKDAYRYLSNIQKNAAQTGDLFSLIPAEIPGNITCISHPNTAVIGFVEVSTTSEKKQWIKSEEAYTQISTICEIIWDARGLQIQPNWAYYYLMVGGVPKKFWSPVTCLDCTYEGMYGIKGTKEKPSFWPNDHM